MIRLVFALLFTLLAVIFCLPAHFSFQAAIKKNHIDGWTKAWKFVRKFFKGVIFLIFVALTIDRKALKVIK